MHCNERINAAWYSPPTHHPQQQSVCFFFPFVFFQRVLQYVPFSKLVFTFSFLFLSFFTKYCNIFLFVRFLCRKKQLVNIPSFPLTGFANGSVLPLTNVADPLQGKQISNKLTRLMFKPDKLILVM